MCQSANSPCCNVCQLVLSSQKGLHVPRLQWDSEVLCHAVVQVPNH